MTQKKYKMGDIVRADMRFFGSEQTDIEIGKIVRINQGTSSGLTYKIQFNKPVKGYYEWWFPPEFIYPICKLNRHRK